MVIVGQYNDKCRWSNVVDGHSWTIKMINVDCHSWIIKITNVDGHSWTIQDDKCRWS